MPQTNRDVWVLPAGGKPTPFLATTRDERSAMLSPDGLWMVYAVLEAGREEEVYVQRYPGPGDRAAVSVGGGREPVWSPSGDEIFYRSIDGERMMAVSVRTEPTLRIDQPRTLFQGQFRLGTFWSEYRREPKDEGVSHGRCRRTDTAEACGGHELSAGSRTVARIGGEIAMRQLAQSVSQRESHGSLGENAVSDRTTL